MMSCMCHSGRTFPSHPYFSTQLGPGQLSLFNLLKAYSLLDEEVGYCQGLSFIAGILLMHVSSLQSVLFHTIVVINVYKRFLSFFIKTPFLTYFIFSTFFIFKNVEHLVPKLR